MTLEIERDGDRAGSGGGVVVVGVVGAADVVAVVSAISSRVIVCSEGSMVCWETSLGLR